MTYDTCKKCKHKVVAHPGHLQPLAILEQAWTNVTMDFIEGLPKLEGKSCISVVVNKFTKFSHFLSLSHPFTAQEVVKIFLDSTVKLHRVPRPIVSNRNEVFTNLFWQRLLQTMGTKLYTTAYHPKTNGQSERVNQCLETYLQCLCFLQPKGGINGCP